MKNNKEIFWITRTAIFIALLVVLQAATASLGNQFITGSIVNMMLVVSVMTCGLASGLTVASVSSVMAKLLGIGPLWSLIPFMIAGNITLVLIWHFIGNRNISKNKFAAYITALIIAAIMKFAVLYIGIVKIAVPVLLKLPATQATVISGIFSFPQLITATIGGVIAIIIFPRLKKAFEKGIK